MIDSKIIADKLNELFGADSQGFVDVSNVAVLAAPADFTPKQIAEFQAWWDSHDSRKWPSVKFIPCGFAPSDVVDCMYDTPIAVRNAMKTLKRLCASGPESDIAFALLETVAFRNKVVLTDHVGDLDGEVREAVLADHTK